MGKIILLLVLAFIAYVVIKGAVRRGRRPEHGATQAEHMVACRHCQVNLPTSEALLEGGHYYCSEEHRRLGAG
jgi:uncharacterized protein